MIVCQEEEEEEKRGKTGAFLPSFPPAMLARPGRQEDSV